MAQSGRKLDLRLTDDRAEMSDLLVELGIVAEPELLDFAVSHLNQDWLVAWASQYFNLTLQRGTSAVRLTEWVTLVRALFNMRNVVGVGEQIRRLNLRSHEVLDTAFAVRIAGRYVNSGYTVRFEPNGNGCSDLLIENGVFRSYVEIKRENEQEHDRWQRINKITQAVLGDLEPRIRSWLEDRELRLEVKFSRLFSDATVHAIGEEIDRRVPTLNICDEQLLNTVPQSRYMVLPRLHEPFYEKGVHTAVFV